TVLGLALTLAFGPRPGPLALNPVLLSAVGLIVLGTVVGVVRGNESYFLLRDLRSAAYFLAGAYLTSAISAETSLTRVALRWMALSVLVASGFQWWRFLNGLTYGAVALDGSASPLRDVSIFQYTYAFAFGVIASR